MVPTSHPFLMNATARQLTLSGKNHRRKIYLKNAPSANSLQNLYKSIKLYNKSNTFLYKKALQKNINSDIINLRRYGQKPISLFLHHYCRKTEKNQNIF